ncbi:MFS-type transporter SLC18B1-like [Agrilus planipennis]|uniref:MFS-type transporter SLC18B1-like n=1 Tax=Agrilus planipennis TaxID=224129 RepID=A0A1W4WLT8_AGRPL|nr:MFS-type transporter SLC18B1-like [Agrilus planipennis]
MPHEELSKSELNSEAVALEQKCEPECWCLNSTNIRTAHIARSKSLSHINDTYTTGEIRRIQERLLRTNSQIHRSVLKNFSSTQKVTLISLSFVNFMSFCSMSIMAPFFPKEAAEKGLSDTLSGFVFSFYALVMFLTSPLFGKIIPRVGAKFLFISGIFVAGTCNILFGALEYVHDYTSFVGLCFTIRGFEALGASAFSTATHVFVIRCFPEYISTVLGILETFVGLGMSVGPAFGGFLYSLGGFEMPFFVLGVAMIAVIPLNFFLLPPSQDLILNPKKESMWKLLKAPSVILTCCVVVVVSSTWGFLDPTLEPHLRQFNLQPEKVGLIFLMFSSIYAIFSPIWGWLCDRFQDHWSMMVWGLILNTISLLCVGPCPFLPFLESSIWLNLLALSGMGISVALALLPTFQCVLKGALASGFSESLATYSIVAGIWSSVYSLGEVVGPSVGGILLQYYGFPTAATVMAAMTFLVLIPTLIFCGCQNGRNKNNENLSDSGISASWRSEDSEQSPLLESTSDANHRLYVQEKVNSYEQSRKMDYMIGDLDPDQPTDFRGTVTVTSKGACEA